MVERRLSRSEYAYRYLVAEVLRGRWQADETLSTYSLAAELGLSRTPVLEAMKRLEAEGLIEIIPQVGSRVAEPDPAAVEGLFDVLASLIGPAAAAAARRVTPSQLSELRLTMDGLEAAASSQDRAAHDELEQQFQYRLILAAGIPQLLDASRSIATPLRYRLTRLPTPPHQLCESAREHRDLLTALERRSPAQARAAAERHLRLSAARFLVSLDAGASGGLVHQALIYRREAEFLVATVPYVTAGLERGERVLIVSTTFNRDLLARALGRQAEAVEFWDAAEWYARPSHTLLSYQQYVEQSDRERVRIIGELCWDGGGIAAMEQWTRYEAMLNVAFALEPVSIVCPYDARKLPASIVADARRTHPAICTVAGPAPSDEFTDVAVITRELDRRQLPPPTATPVIHAISPDLRDARRFILDQARRAGVSGKRLQDTLLAAQEVARDVVSRGPGHGTIAAWLENGQLIYEVRDRRADATYPRTREATLRAALISEPGSLWLSRLLCDLVEARIDDGAPVVRLHIDLSD